MSEIVEILMARDGIKETEAVETYKETKEMIREAMADGCGYDEVEEILADELGLEMDYIFAFI